MSNGHTLDHSVQRQQITVITRKWPDGYWEVDLTVSNADSTARMACIPLLSGSRPIRRVEVLEIQHLCSLAVEVITELDDMPDPF